MAWARLNSNDSWARTCCRISCFACPAGIDVCQLVSRSVSTTTASSTQTVIEALLTNNNSRDVQPQLLLSVNLGMNFIAACAVPLLILRHRRNNLPFQARSLNITVTHTPVVYKWWSNIT